jgi:hypothetical protein
MTRERTKRKNIILFTAHCTINIGMSTLENSNCTFMSIFVVSLLSWHEYVHDEDMDRLRKDSKESTAAASEVTLCVLPNDVGLHGMSWHITTGYSF